jgi:hypothetical protein
MISAVNGYVCFSSCDAAKAKQGKDPHTFPDPADEKLKANDAHKPAAIFDGALKDAQASGDVGAMRQSLVNKLV